MRAGPTLVAVAVMLLAGVSGCLGGSGPESADPATARRIAAERNEPPVYEGEWKFDGGAQVLVPGPYAVHPPVLQILRSELGGVDIEIGYWLPDAPPDVKFPVIIEASPYHRPAGSVVRNSGMKSFLVEQFGPHGYAVAAVAVRGTGNSGGCMDLFGDREAADLSQAITWLATQEWSNGNVTLIGVSYPGSTPWVAARTGNEHVKTIVPIAGVPDLYRLMYKNGSSEIRGPLVLNALYYSYGWAPDDPNRDPEKRVEGLCVADAEAQGLAWSVYSPATGERDPVGWWEERNNQPRVEENYEGSVFLFHGFQDWNVDPSQPIPWVDSLNRSGTPVKYMLGQWGHGFGNRWDRAELLLRWWDYYLKGKTTVVLGPAAHVQDDLGRWHIEESYPPRDANWTTLHLGANNQLVSEPGAAGTAFLAPNPAGVVPAANLRAVPGPAADFYTNAPEEGLWISGLPKVHVTVSPYGVGGNLAAWLYDVDESGNERRVGWTTMNLRFYDGGETARTLTPREPIRALMEIQPMDTYIAPGHRLLLRLWQYSSDQQISAGPVQDRQTVVSGMPVDVLFGGSVKSTLELPVIQRGEEAYYEPPTPPPD